MHLHLERTMRLKMSDTTTELTRLAGLEHERFMNACREVLNGNPYDGDWLEQLRVAMEKADDAMKASWVPVDD